MTETRLKIAVFIDFDNIEIGVKATLNQQFDVAAILEVIKERGEVVTKVAYGDWKRASDYGRILSQHAIRMVQRNLTPGGDKNGADINLALDALEMAFTHDHINAFVIVGGDSDFITLVEKLKQYDKKVFVVGGRQFTSLVMQKNCHEFIAYENLVGGRRATAQGRRSSASPSGPTDMTRALPLVKRALKVLVDREVTPQLGLLKSTLLQLDSTFSERDYGASTFRDFMEKIAKTGVVTLRHSGRNMLVDLAEADHVSDASTDGTAAHAHEATGENGQGAERPPSEKREAAPAPDPARAQEAVQRVRDLFQQAGQPPRWPLYVRQVKQYLRAVDASFDERAWGFTTIVELLRACQRESVLRLERDRKGVLRVFPGTDAPHALGSTDTPGQHEQTGERDASEIGEAQEADGQAVTLRAAAVGELSVADAAPTDGVEKAPEQNALALEKPVRTARARRPRRTPATRKPAARRSGGTKATTRNRPDPDTN